MEKARLLQFRGLWRAKKSIFVEVVEIFSAFWFLLPRLQPPIRELKFCSMFDSFLSRFLVVVLQLFVFFLWHLMWRYELWKCLLMERKKSLLGICFSHLHRVKCFGILLFIRKCFEYLKFAWKMRSKNYYWFDSRANTEASAYH